MISAFPRNYDLSHSTYSYIFFNFDLRNLQSNSIQLTRIPPAHPFPQKLFSITVSNSVIISNWRKRFASAEECGVRIMDMCRTYHPTLFEPRRSIHPPRSLLVRIPAPSNEITIFTQVHKRLYHYQTRKKGLTPHSVQRRKNVLCILNIRINNLYIHVYK